MLGLTAGEAARCARRQDVDEGAREPAAGVRRVHRCRYPDRRSTVEFGLAGTQLANAFVRPTPQLIADILPAVGLVPGI
jgi:hypothetical protein